MPSWGVCAVRGTGPYRVGVGCAWAGCARSRPGGLRRGRRRWARAGSPRHPTPRLFPDL